MGERFDLEKAMATRDHAFDLLRQLREGSISQLEFDETFRKIPLGDHVAVLGLIVAECRVDEERAAALTRDFVRRCLGGPEPPERPKIVRFRRRAK